MIRSRTLLVQLGTAKQVGHELGGLAVAQALEESGRGVELAAAPAWPLVEELGACEADEEDRRVTGPVRQVLDEVEEGRLGPLQVVEEDDERPGLRLRFEQAADGPGGFVRRAWAPAEA